LALLAGLGGLAMAAAGPAFAPFEDWKAAVVRGDAVHLAAIYSSTPPAAVTMTKDDKPVAGSLDDERRYWAGLTAGGMTQLHPKVLELERRPGEVTLVLRVEGVRGGEKVVAGMRQVWARQKAGWRMVASTRSDFAANAVRTLPQPTAPNVNLYADPTEGPAELEAALRRAAREHKRVIAVFGANWCYDCHVLDTAFRSTEFAPLVNASYVVVHISIGDEGKDNGDLAARLGVVLDKGVPSLAVLEADGRVVYAQRDGEFESTVKIGPADVRAFLEKWKPGRANRE